jgi:radical SAM superfamily enzyme YgiQ (UPF0313 family)
MILVNPRICDRENIRLPLSVLALGAVLEDRYDYEIVDENVEPDGAGAVLRALAAGPCALVGLTVMPGPQVGPAIRISSAVRAAHPDVPIAWGGYFPTLYANAAINAPYVDYVIRGQGEETLLDLLERLPDAGPPGPSASARDGALLRAVPGLTWKDDGRIVHNPERPFRSPDEFPVFPYHRLGDVRQYLRPTFLGSRTGVHQAAIGCRYRCTFCGVVSMFNGHTQLGAASRLQTALTTLRDRYGATAIQFFDHNFFDGEETSVPILEELARAEMPWWCYARADTLAKFSTGTWELIRRSRLRMAYIGAEAASDEVLKRMKKGTRVEHTLEVAARCREYGVIPEFSFVLGGPQDPAGEIDRTFVFIRQLKRLHPECEVILYFYSPTPQRDPASVRRARPDEARLPVLSTYGPSGPALPTTPEEWTEPRWVDYVCHQDAPWLSPELRQSVSDFATVLACRFPTVQDVTTPRWGRGILRELARWRYGAGRYRNPWELRLARRLIPLRRPERDSL